MPDALSKTVPIWCSVLNRAVSDEDEWKTLEFPAESVPPQEASSIRALFPSFLRSLEVMALYLSLTSGCQCNRNFYS